MLHGDLLIDGRREAGGGARFAAVEAGPGIEIAPDFASATLDQVDRACAAANHAFDSYRAIEPANRARFLDAIADRLDARRDDIVARGQRETALSPTRLGNETTRAVHQLRLFARVLGYGDWAGVRIDHALPDRTPLPRPDLRQHRIPLGPVAVFGASNFPLAFSVAGGDTASALAAGCPVVVKAHPAHPGLSEIAGAAIQAAATETGMPTGVFALLHDAGRDVGSALVSDPRIAAVGFTGSRAGGLALSALAAARPRPIPVYAEMSSTNPVVLLPAALTARGDAIADAFVTSLMTDAGQFCTGPGLILAVGGPALDRFTRRVAAAIDTAASATMLTEGIAAAYRSDVVRRQADGARLVAGGKAGGRGVSPALLQVDGATLRDCPGLADEVFGPAAVVVRCRDLAEIKAILASLDGQLTVAFHFDSTDQLAVAALLPVAEKLVGRIIANGFGTGVEVCDAIIHGGPFPATSDGRSTSVGSTAIERFLRPICYQNMPEALLPASIAQANPLGMPRMIDGRRG